MTTDLVVVTSGIDPMRVRAAIPPSCVTDVIPGCAIVLDRHEAMIEIPRYSPRRPARHFVPSLALLDPADVALQFELSVRVASGWSSWAESVVVGSAEPGTAGLAQKTPRDPPPEDPSEALRCDVDVFSTPTPVDAVRARVRLRAPNVEHVLRSPWLFALSASDLERVPHRSDDVVSLSRRVEIPVPPRSQMEASEALARRICSPTSIAMILEQRGHAADLESLAAEMFQPDVALYGVWPAAIAAAGRRGIAGYLLRFPDWTAARWCLDARLPVVASVRYAEGEIRGAAIAETTGHLIVLTGYEGDDVLVNDPAAPTRSEVSRRYARADLERVWLDRTGVGYVFFGVT